MKAIKVSHNKTTKYFASKDSAFRFLTKMSFTGKVYATTGEAESELYIPDSGSYTYYTDNDMRPDIVLDMFGSRDPQKEWEVSYINIED